MILYLKLVFIIRSNTFQCHKQEIIKIEIAEESPPLAFLSVKHQLLQS